ncbi:E3 ubiquitin-protein ligase bre1 [Marasmius crinis-equi]|uniref:E3 ubiquitin protein ligase n=1 Tax=Marasmius crinis-equi TaxID=585013 RepID=A0ABR3FTF0_9AGAR
MSTTRKRSHSVESEATSLKKRIIADENGEPHPNVNGVASQQEDLELSGQDKLELFRKEAIYRRMKHYSREYEHSQARIAELEERKVTCEAGLAAMSACWQQLVDTLQSLVKSDEQLPTTDNIRDLYTISTYVSEDSMPELKSSLEKTQEATTQVVSKLLSKSGRPSDDEWASEYRKAQAESAALRSQVDVLLVRLQDYEERTSRYKEALSLAENRLERTKSKTVQDIQPKSQPKSEDQDGVTENEQRKPSSPAPNGDHALHAHLESYWQEVAEQRHKQIQEFEREKHELKTRIHILEVQLQVPTHGQVTRSSHYQIAATRLTMTTQTLHDRETEIAKLKDELHQTKEANKQAEEASKASSIEFAVRIMPNIFLQRDFQQEVNELKNLLAQRDTNLARLRESRDQQVAELHERKTRETVRIQSCEENKTLAESRGEHINVLNSQLKRCRLQLAAQANREDIVSLLMDNPNDVNYIETLHAKLQSAEKRLAALDQACSKLDAEQPDIARHIQGETEALQKLSEVSAELEKYRTVYGELSSLQPDAGQLASQLQQKEDELQRLRLLEQQREQTETSLYTEIEKLSAAWETLDNQVKSKVFDLTSMEEKLTRALTEKAKAENKFYATMRDKEGIELERRTLHRNLEKHAKVVEALKETESKLSHQITMAQKVISAREQTCSLHDRELRELRNKSKELEYKFQEEHNKFNSLFRSISDTEHKTANLRERLRTAIEEQTRSKKDLQRQALKLQSKERLLSSARGRGADQDADSTVADSLKLLSKSD